MESKFKEKLSLVPHKPGSYQMIDKNGVIIYVGKAKDLHKRVSSYFNRIHTGKTAKMVSLIDDFKYVVASSEIEAFIIEINLIKKFKPKSIRFACVLAAPEGLKTLKKHLVFNNFEEKLNNNRRN